ncbi:MAG: glycosyltransferase [Dehalococcoidia bacterium]
MLQTVDVGIESLNSYCPVVSDEQIEDVRKLARELKGARILHLNATPYGGGVSELLRSVIPLLRDLGLRADWKIIFGDEQFFGVTKSFHNALQGDSFTLKDEVKEVYLANNIKNAELLEAQYDFIVVHDPQPLALRHFKGRNNSKWIWRCHIDTSEPNPELWDFLEPFANEYDAAIFTLDKFVPPTLKVPVISSIPPSIDPLSPKNMFISANLARKVTTWAGVDIKRPLLTQVSRFDPWKDPLGVIDVYRKVREDIPDLQLALVGSMALDDPEAWAIYSKIADYAKGDPSTHVFTNLSGVGNIEVNAFQQLSPVIIQKSIREGFGLVVSETLWKETPVVAGNTGGIPLQLEDGVSGYLCDTVDEYASRISYLFRNRDEAHEMGKRGKQKVKDEFLTPRMIADELRLLCSL